jgi:peptide/nickel transport system substrate-binding protein
VIELRGDEALAVFGSTRQALRAAIELQRVAGGSEGTEPALPLGVGIGLDAGEAVPLEKGYRGAALTFQVLPSGTPGYSPYCPYTTNPTKSGAWTAPDLAKAQKLVTESGTRGQKVTVWSDNNPFPLIAGRLAVATLKELGYRAVLNLVPFTQKTNFWDKILDSRTRAQVGLWAWDANYPSASDFLLPETCSGFRSADPAANVNPAEFCNPQFERAYSGALAAESADAPATASTSWASIDRRLTDLSPWVTLMNPQEVVVVSKRAGNVQAAPQWGVLVDQIWVR